MYDIQALPEEVKSTDSRQDVGGRDPTRAAQLITSLEEILTPQTNGNVLFGAQNNVLRLSQVEALTEIRHCLDDGTLLGHIVQPGGTGKTWEAIITAYAMHQHDRNTLYIVPSQQAVEDFAAKARTLCPDLDVGTVYQVAKRIGRLTFATYASTLLNLLGENAEEEARNFVEEQANDEEQVARDNAIVTINPADYDLVVWDEVHRYLTKNAQALLQRFRNAINIGFTATPRYYEGKEVAGMFGKLIHELDLETAIERKEVSDFRNLLITTDITTDLELSSPDQEESAEVARAIDIPSRNDIFPEMYLNAKIEVNKKKYTLAGEPAIVFGASIDHVHDIAEAFNNMLTPALQENAEFRSILEKKGIDPDAVEEIAAPIHSGSSDTYARMPLAERNALVDRYHARKVLVLCATSVLQQSFDSQPTSVVFDSVPRQTHVGVGQAGMRALRWLEDKEMAFIINTQDVDHSSLTFLDFQAVRGHEQGVIVDIGDRQTGTRRQSQKRAVTTPENTSQYNVTYGTELLDLAERKKLHKGTAYWNDVRASLLRLTPLGSRRVRQCIADMQSGSKEAIWTFVDIIQPWIERNSKQVALHTFGNEHVDDIALNTADSEVLFSLIDQVCEGKVSTWSRFSQDFRRNIQRRYKTLRESRGEIPTVSLNDEVQSRSTIPDVSEDDIESTALNEFDIVEMLETLPSDQYPENHQLHEVSLKDLNQRISKVLRTLSWRKSEVIKLRYGIPDGHSYTLEELGGVFECTGSNVGAIEKKAMETLRQPSRSFELVGFLPFERQWPLEGLKKKEEAQRQKEQPKINNRILWEIEEELVAQKTIVYDALRCGKDAIAWKEIFDSMQPHPAILLQPLSDIEWTRVNDLIASLALPELDQVLQNLHLAQIPESGATAILEAVEAIRCTMKKFKEMGGRSTAEDDILWLERIRDSILPIQEEDSAEEKDVLVQD